MKKFIAYLIAQFKLWLSYPGNDKKAHAWVGILGMLFVGLPLAFVFYGGLVTGLIFVIVLATLKEIGYDKILGKGVCSFWDWIATVFPALTVYILLLMIINTIQGNGIATGLFDK